jgi:hypothetical protein
LAGGTPQWSHLPEISAESFTLVWDFEAGESRTLIKHEGVPIFSEPARYEEYRRFEEIAQR